MSREFATDEQKEFEYLSEMRGFKTLPKVKSNKRVILRKGNTVWFDGSEYTVVKAIGGPLLEKVR